VVAGSRACGGRVSFYGDEGKRVIEHVQRPRIPWRKDEPLTECGLSVTGPHVLTRETFLRKLKEQGVQRAMLSTCYTCGETAQRHPDWNKSPSGCIDRETGGFGHREKSKTLDRELRALAALVARHPEEFDELLRDVIEVVSLDEHRRNPRAGKRDPVLS